MASTGGSNVYGQKIIAHIFLLSEDFKLGFQYFRNCIVSLLLRDCKDEVCFIFRPYLHICPIKKIPFAIKLQVPMADGLVLKILIVSAKLPLSMPEEGLLINGRGFYK